MLIYTMMRCLHLFFISIVFRHCYSIKHKLICKRSVGTFHTFQNLLISLSLPNQLCPHHMLMIEISFVDRRFAAKKAEVFSDPK